MDNEIAVDARTATGKQNRRLRLTGQVPAVVFGKGRESLPVQVEAKAFETLYRAAGRTTLVNLQIDGGRPTSAVIKSVQRHPLSGRALHVDFFLVDLTQEMEVEVPLVFLGEPPAIELTGGTLMTPISQIRVRALPAEMPHEIAVDVTPLVDLEAAIHVRDLVVADNVHIQADGDELLARVIPPRVEEEPEAEEVEAEEGAEGAEGAGEAGTAERAAEGEGRSETEASSEG
ncbi:MAG TPA: 50S ribosomal protein L25 [Candidatus Limnocylindria bacterium]|nr:50S ribosomal protein L25 [Candidatus Limnocylindria bacterium]